MKKASALVKLAFPLGLIGAMLKSYTLKASGDSTFGIIGIWAGILIGSVTALFLTGFLIFIHFKLFEVPEDLFTGPMFGKPEPMFGGNPAIFRQGLATSLCLIGAGLGFLLSTPIFEVSTLGVGLSLLAPGIAGSALLIGLWRRSYT
jgi:hypothetical protein